MRILSLLMLAMMLVASGCMGGGTKATPSPSESDPNVLPPGVTNVLEGTVTGPDLAPLQGVNVSINGLGWSNITNEAGHYRFESLPPKDYIITATKEGYRPKPQRAIIQDDAIFQLDFQLEEVPLEEPRHTTEDYTFLISCQVAYQTSPDNPLKQDCVPTALPDNKQVRAFSIERGAAQVQAEFFWQPGSQGAKNLYITMESTGANGVQFAYDKGESGMKALISESLMRKNFPDGGQVVVRVDAATGVLGEESALDVGWAIQQRVNIHFTVFYVEPGPPNFTARPA